MNRSLWTQLPQQYTGHAASINSARPAATFSKADTTIGINADIGGGKYDNAPANTIVYDPFNRSPEHNAKTLEIIRDGQCQTATVNNVLNVIKEPHIRDQIIAQAANCAPVAYFLIYEGNRSGQGAVSRNGTTWQENRKTDSYVDEIKQVFATVTRKGNLLRASK
jgi:hypothetical protein|tara:strand:- start:32 stop:526 length:495 start_codon:yes stop_codon:yes gene_type:complete